MVSSSDKRWPPRAALVGSTSPMMSAMVTSGVASFSTKRDSRGSQAIGVPAPCSATSSRPNLDRRERIVVHLAPRENGNLLVEQRDELAQDAAFRLPAQ